MFFVIFAFDKNSRIYIGIPYLKIFTKTHAWITFETDFLIVDFPVIGKEPWKIIRNRLERIVLWAEPKKPYPCEVTTHTHTQTHTHTHIYIYKWMRFMSFINLGVDLVWFLCLMAYQFLWVIECKSNSCIRIVKVSEVGDRSRGWPEGSFLVSYYIDV